MGTAIVVVSGKGGTGKTTTVGAVASCLASRGHRTLCIDCDVGLKNLDLNLGLTGLTLRDFQDVLNGSVSLEDAVLPHPDMDDLHFLSAPSMARPEDIDAAAFRDLITAAKDSYEFCFIDAPAGIGPGFQLAAESADMALIVITGDAFGVRDGQRVTAELQALGLFDIRLVVNKVKKKFFRKTSSTIDDVIDSVGARLIGVVEDSDKVALAGSIQKPLVMCDPSQAMRQFNRISRRIEGENIPLGRIK